MDISKIIPKIEAQLSGREFRNTVISAGEDLFMELQLAGKIKAESISLSGKTDAVPMDVYDSRFMIVRNIDLPVDSFRVGP